MVVLDLLVELFPSFQSEFFFFFAWELWWGKILTLVKLKNRRYLMASVCPCCGNAKEMWSTHSVSQDLDYVNLLLLLSLDAVESALFWFKILLVVGFVSH